MGPSHVLHHYIYLQLTTKKTLAPGQSGVFYGLGAWRTAAASGRGSHYHSLEERADQTAKLPAWTEALFSLRTAFFSLIKPK